jgi:transcriptional regulator with XRE-family HTH domain
MLFANKIRELRECKQIFQRHVSAALDMDNAMYCKIERGDRRAKKEQIPIIAKILQTDPKELLILWLADQIVEVVENEKELAKQALRIAQQVMK